MSKRKNAEAAEADVRPDADEAVSVASGQDAAGEVAATASQPQDAAAEASPEPALRTVLEFAAAKGHVPVHRPIRTRADALHRGPHIAVVCAHARWPQNKLVSEAQYDEAVRAAYSVSCGENLLDQAAKLQAANERAESAR